jgi:hypothetical protein
MRSSLTVAVVSTLFATGCDETIDRRMPTSSTQGATHGGASTAFDVANTIPDLFILTTPRADAQGRVSGPGPLSVTFNACPSTDADEGDRLRATFDFDGDGQVDAAGHCRATHEYTADARAVVCVSDRQPDHRVCREFSIELRSRTAARDRCRTRVRSVGRETEPNDTLGSASGPFTEPTQARASLAAGGDTDWYVFENTCEAPVIVQARTFGPGGRGDCSAPADSRMSLWMELGGVGGGSAILAATTCAGPAATVGLAPGSQVWFRVEGTSASVVPYQLQLLTSTDTVWSGLYPLE